MKNISGMANVVFIAFMNMNNDYYNNTDVLDSFRRFWMTGSYGLGHRRELSPFVKLRDSDL